MTFDSRKVRLDSLAQVNPKRSVVKGSEVAFIDMAAVPQHSRDINPIDIAMRIAKGAGAHFKNGDTLLARITPCLENGKTAQVSVLKDDEIGEGSTEFIVLCGIDAADNDYIYYLCRDPSFREYAVSRMEGTSGRQRVSWQSIAAYEFECPLENERREAAKVLAGIDDRINLLRSTNVTLEKIAKALFRSWFVNFDPVKAKQDASAHSGIDEATTNAFPNGFESSEIGDIPKGWRVESLDETATFLNGLALQKFPPKNTNVLPVIKIAELRKGNTSGADIASGDIKQEYVIKDGDVLFSWSGSLEVEIWCGGTGALNQHLFKVSSTDYKKWFYYLWTKHHLDSFRRIAESKATTMGHIQRAHLSDAKVVIPNTEVLSIANEVFSPIIDSIIKNALHAKTLEEVRNTLLPKLISGKLSSLQLQTEKL